MKLHEQIINGVAPFRENEYEREVKSIQDNLSSWKEYLGLKNFSFLWNIEPRASPRGRASYRRAGAKVLPYISMPDWYAPYKAMLSSELAQFIKKNQVPFQAWRVYGIHVELGFPYPETVRVGGKSIKVREEMIVSRKPTTQKASDCDNLLKTVVDALMAQSKSGYRVMIQDDHELLEMVSIKTRNPSPYIRADILYSQNPEDPKNFIFQY